MDRKRDIEKLYIGLMTLKGNTGGFKFLKDPSLRNQCPKAGVYFFFDLSELREDGGTPRIVRVGTHAISETSKSTLWSRLAQHRGNIKNGAGNHRGSIFRKLVGISAIKYGNSSPIRTWGMKSSIGAVARDFDLNSSEVSRNEFPLEKKVSEYIRNLPFLWLKIEDPANGRAQRSIIERNTIALLSNYRRSPIDPRSKGWLGNHCDYGKGRKVMNSGLWNNDFVDEDYDPSFLGLLNTLIDEAEF